MLAVLAISAFGVVTTLTSSGRIAAADVDAFSRGGEVFQANCAACHGTRGEGGREGDLEVVNGPAIAGLELAYIDLTVRTGRMPIAEPSVGVRAEELGDADREALNVYALEALGARGTLPEVSSGDASRGQDVYVRNCAACHGAAADGGISGANVQVPPLVGLDGIAIASATRVGPFEMPAFDAAVIDDEAIDDIIGYLDLVDATPRSYAGVREVDQIGTALFGIPLALVAAVVALVVARARRWYPREPEGIHADPPFPPRGMPGPDR